LSRTATIKLSNEVRDRLKGKPRWRTARWASNWSSWRALGRARHGWPASAPRSTQRLLKSLRHIERRRGLGIASSMTEAEAPAEMLVPGDVVWVKPEIVVGREQAGRRPALVVAGAGYVQTVDRLVLVVPITAVDRGWPNHIEVLGTELQQRAWAMSEQIRTISRERLVGRAGRANDATLATVRSWLADVLEL
jgi:mRNA interferase MazF